MLVTSAPVQAGNSGGPLLDGAGDLVGVVSAKLDAAKMTMKSGDLQQSVNFAVKSAILASFLDANRVSYKVGTAGQAMEPADIADQARAMSGFVVCRLETFLRPKCWQAVCQPFNFLHRGRPSDSRCSPRRWAPYLLPPLL